MLFFGFLLTLGAPGCFFSVFFLDLAVDILHLYLMVFEVLMAHVFIWFIKLSKQGSFLEKFDQEVGVIFSEHLVVDEDWLGSLFESDHEYNWERIFRLAVMWSLNFINLLNSDLFRLVFHAVFVRLKINSRDLSWLNALIYIYNQTSSRSWYIHMSHPQILQNTFDPRTIKDILKKIEYVTFDQSAQNVMKEIQQLSPTEYLWAVGRSPAYFIQYQVKSAAVLKVLNHVLIVWRPKFIEYPSIIKFPQLKDKKPNNLSISIQNGSTTTAGTNQALVEFLEPFYGTYFYSDKDFETNLVTYSKHFISKITRHSYWHGILDDTDRLFVTQMSKMGNICKVRITGMKEGYDKTLLLFSYQGQRGNFFMSAKNKWMQILSFLGMIIIFYAIVACDANQTEGICAYRQQMTLSGAGIMLALIGLRYGQKKKKEKKQAKKPTQSVNPDINKQD